MNNINLIVFRRNLKAFKETRIFNQLLNLTDLPQRNAVKESGTEKEKRGDHSGGGGSQHSHRRMAKERARLRKEDRGFQG